MADIKNSDTQFSGFSEACCIDAGRVYDSCCDRDCADDLRCYFTPDGQNLIDTALNVKLRKAEVLNVYINVEPVNFNRGFYSCDLTFLFLVKFDVYCSPNSCPTPVNGVTSFSKRVILYGGDGNAKVFSNTVENICDLSGDTSSNAPKCTVQCVEPIPLSCKIGQVRDCCENIGICDDCINRVLGGSVVTSCPGGSPTVYVTLGLFTIIQIIRNVQMLIPVYDFCVPQKQCTDTSDTPCDVFGRIKFPVDDFFPPKCPDDSNNYGCSCNK